ncbi:MAG: FG-GAP-like repeat-containing protein, partial [Dysgonamonadaceae bacterium]|nr:FG-GAP-like repeat-containing protein [Dysgonamonadaceae bacterium]
MKRLIYKTVIFAFFAFCSFYGKAQTAENWTLNTAQTGTKTYIARESITLKPGFSYKASSGNTFTAKIDETLLFPPSDNTYAKPDGTITTDASQGAVVGSLSGTFDISPSGAAIYNIPIEIPAGINGMQPNISLFYNSQSGNGIAGWGWNIGGLSLISRTGNTLYHDGKVAAVELKNSDNLILDGQRLILVSGTHFTNGAKYRTEIETYSDVAYKKIGNYLCFEVITKEGIKHEYGSSSDSYIEAQGTSTPLVWLLKKVTDTNGNYMTYEYSKNSSGGEYRLSRINYTANDMASVSAVNEVSFEYEDRHDSTVCYVAGTKVLQTKRLKYIYSKNGSRIYRKYTVQYAKNLYSQITEFKVETADGISYPPTVISWKNPYNNYSKNYNSIGNRLFNSQMNPVLDCNNPIFVDFSGDKRRDLITLKDKKVKLYLNEDDHGSCEFIQKCEFEVYASSGNTLIKLIPADLNGDGLMDLISVVDIPEDKKYQTPRMYRYNYYFFDGEKFSNGGGSGYKGFNTFPGNAAYSDDYIIGDFNGDGKHEILIKSTQKVYNSEGTEIASGGISSWGDELLPSFPNNLNLLDFTGNGKTNICIRSGSNGYIYELNGNTFTQILTTNQLSNLDDIYTGDYNGDGKSDLFVIKFNESKPDKHEGLWLLSTGSSFIKKDITSLNISSNTLKGFSGDFNLDGKADFAIVEYQYVSGSNYLRFRIGINNDSGFDFETYSSECKIVSTDDWQYLDVADYDGDGRSEINYSKCPSSSSYNTWFIYSFNDSFFPFIRLFSNGLTEKCNVIFRPVTTQLVYSVTSDYNPAFPLVKSLPALYVVCLYEKNDEDFDVYYYNIMQHAQGKGFLGFGRILIKDYGRNICKLNEYGFNQYYYNAFQTKQTIFIVGLETTDTLSVTNFENSVVNLGNKRIFPYVSKQTFTDSLAGISTQTQLLAFDNYGNPAEIKTTAGDIVEKQTISYVQKGSWCLNKPASITTVKQHGSETYTRIKTRAYDSKGNLTAEVIDPGDVNSVTTSFTDYDGFGHARKITTTANGVSRSKTLTYTSSGRFVKTIKNDLLNETSTYNYDESAGLLTSKVDRFGTTSYQYDSFGRIKQTSYPDNIKTAVSLQWAGTIAEKPIDAKYYIYSETSGQSPVWTWYDGQGREIGKDSYGLNKQKIYVDTEYNTDGQVYRVSEPYFASQTGNKTWAATYTYDIYGRIKETVTLLGTTVYDYSGLTTTVTSPFDKRKTTVNKAGWTVEEETNGKKVTFTHYASGLVKTATPEGGKAISMEYDLQGNRTKIIDPDAGTVTSKYDGWGQLTKTEQKVHTIRTRPFPMKEDSLPVEQQANAEDVSIVEGILIIDRDIVAIPYGLIETSYGYKPSGLLDYKTVNNVRTSYRYDGKNRLSSISIDGKHAQGFVYDSYDRIVQTSDTVDGSKIFVRKMEYDVLGRVRKEIYPDGYSVTNQYETYGYLKKITDSKNNMIWEAIESNARGQLTKTKRGSKTTVFSFDSRGFPTSISTPGVVNMAYSFDSKGNPTYRQDNLTSQKESFTYDTMNRLTGSIIYKNSVAQSNYTMSYNSTTGNISTKSDIGYTMNYGENGKPHALTSISGQPSAIPSLYQNISYTDFKKVKNITEGDNSLSISYGVDEQRIKSVLSTATGSLTRYYIGSYEEETVGSNTRKIHYLGGGNGLAAIYVQNGGKDTLYHAHTDFLGSLIAITDASGNVKEKYAFSAFGKRVNPSEWRLADTRTAFLFNRGYTMHEHLSEFGLINMNGRVYDPLIAQFLSPDPYIQMPGNWLNYNRYSYCLNNPLKYTDPSGEVVWFVPVIIGAVVGAYTGASIQSGTAAFWDWKPDAWKGAIAGGIIGA